MNEAKKKYIQSVKNTRYSRYSGYYLQRNIKRDRGGDEPLKLS